MQRPRPPGLRLALRGSSRCAHGAPAAAHTGLQPLRFLCKEGLQGPEADRHKGHISRRRFQHTRSHR